MTDHVQDSQFDNILELLSEHGFDGMKEAMETLFNEAMKIERSVHLGAGLHERSDARAGYANGYKNKQVKTRVGELSLKVPQTRDTDFYPASLEKGIRSERALKLALAEMYVQGVSTRKVAKITEQMCGLELSSMQVSRAAKALDEQLSAWRNRPLGNTPYVFLDAQYQKVRHAGRVIDCALLIALGVTETGHRQVLGCSVALSEHEVHWRDFLTELQRRGLTGTTLFISDAHEGLKAARAAVFPSVPWQRCQFHLQQNASKYVPRQSMRREVANDIKGIFTASDDAGARELLRLFVVKYTETAPKLAAWAETALPEGFSIFDLPEGHRRKTRTSNVLERLNKEVKRRTKVAGLFPNEDSCLRLASAVLMEISEEWEAGRVHITM
jgi:transposase-like protein